MSKSQKSSVLEKLHSSYHQHDQRIKATEDWATTVKDHKASFKKLVAMQSKFELALRKHFRDLAQNRVQAMVNWAQYQIDVIKAYDYVVDLDNYDFTDEQDLLGQIMLDFVAQGMSIGIDKGNEIMVHSGLSSTSASVQKAALQRSSKLVSNITESTRSRIQQSVANSLARGETVQEAQSRLEDIIDDPSRAEIIARTETRNSYVDGVSQVADETGVSSKEWSPSTDPCELCQENVDAGEIDVSDDFPNGDDPHPNCLCDAPIYHYPISDNSDSSDNSDDSESED